MNNKPNHIKPTESSPIRRPLITELEIQHRTSQLAQQIADYYCGKEIIIVAILKGAFMFASDLVRRLNLMDVRPELDFIRASSYGSKTESSGEVTIELDVSLPVAGSHILLVDDIIDTGNTISKIYRYLTAKNVADIKTCVLLDKPSRRTVPFKADYIGFEVPDIFVVGYGLDYAERYRCLPYITQISEVE